MRHKKEHTTKISDALKFLKSDSMDEFEVTIGMIARVWTKPVERICE